MFVCLFVHLVVDILESSNETGGTSISARSVITDGGGANVHVDGLSSLVIGDGGFNVISHINALCNLEHV